MTKKPGSSLESTSFSGRKALAMTTILIQIKGFWDSEKQLTFFHPSDIVFILYSHQKFAKRLVTSFLNLQYYDVCLNQRANSACACILRRYNFIIPIIWNKTYSIYFIDSYMHDAKIDSSIPESIQFHLPIFAEFWTCSSLWLTCVPMSNWIWINNPVNWVRVEFESSELGKWIGFWFILDCTS